MATKQQLELSADNIIASVDLEKDPKEQFKIVWLGTVKPILELVKSFTGAKIDEQIARLEIAADRVCDEKNVDVTNYCQIWNSFHLKSLLKFVQTFTGPKVDKAINKFIEISDSFCLN
ncbi:MAG: hypothetical protein WA057_00415 [Candidatus Magasanikiibacteriota bacterium]